MYKNKNEVNIHRHTNYFKQCFVNFQAICFFKNIWKIIINSLYEYITKKLREKQRRSYHSGTESDKTFHYYSDFKEGFILIVTEEEYTSWNEDFNII